MICPHSKDSERGQMLVLFVLAVGVLLGFTALAIDVGLFMENRRSLQNAADAAAMAGIQELPDDPAAAQAKAQEWALNNGIDAGEIDSIDLGHASPGADGWDCLPGTDSNGFYTCLTVNLQRDVGFLFARVLGKTMAPVDATATSATGSPSASAALAPFGVLEDAINYNGPTVLKYDAGSGKKQGQGGGPPNPGNFGALAIPRTYDDPDCPSGVDGQGDQGSNVYQANVSCSTTSFVCAASQPGCADPRVNNEDGNMTGGTRDGMQYRFDNTSTACDEFDDIFQQVGSTYRLSGRCNPFTGATDSHRIMLIPVIDHLPNGRCNMNEQEDIDKMCPTVLYFAAFYADQFDCQGGNECEVTGIFARAVFNPQADAEFGLYDPDSLRFVTLIR